mgnify:CR=1 FL=1
MRMIFAALILSLGAGAAAAKTPLRDVPEIDRPMFAVAMAIEISNKCSDISPRRLKGLAFLNSLKNKALDLGYSESEIKAYVDSEDEKNRMRAMGAQYMRQQGLDPKQTASLCELGRQEMARNSQIGVFLR